MSMRILHSLEYSSELARYLLSRGGLAWSPTAHDLLTRPLTGTPRRAISPGRGPSTPLHLSLREWPRPPFTARIERAQFHRARSASKKGAWPLPSPCWRAFSAFCQVPHFAGVIIAHGLDQFCFCIHHERAIAGHWLIDPLARHHQNRGVLLCDDFHRLSCRDEYGQFSLR